VKIYLAGPIDGCDDAEASDWRELCKKRLGAENCLDPMSDDYRGREHLYAEIVHKDLDLINQCDLVLANCWKKGWGTPMEIMYSYLNDIPVVVVVPPDLPFVSPWLVYHAKDIYTSVDAALTNVEAGLYG
jgi:nucleoside 2-deoxyribosyltransferase